MLLSPFSRRNANMLRFLCFVALSSLAGWAPAQMLPGGLIDPVAIRRYGLERQWSSQVQLSPLGDRVTSLELYEGVLYVQTSAALLQALDAETGKTLWTAHWGQAEHPSTPPAFSKDRVGVVNGTRVHLGSRVDGTLEWERALTSSPADGLSVGDKHVYVPTQKGRVESIDIADPKHTPKYLHLNGRPGRPLLTAKRMCIATDQKSLYLIDPADPSEGARVDTSGVIEAPLAYRAPYVYAASNDGFVYAVDEATGDIRWRASTATPIRKAPVIGLQDLFVVTDYGDLVSLELETGGEQWTAPNIGSVLASTSDRVYARDRFGRLVILDADSGRRLASFMAQEIELAMPNSQNDRLYFVTQAGLVQCLRESDLPQPLVFARPAPADEPAAAAATTPATKPAPTPSAPRTAPARRSTPQARPRPPRGDAAAAGDRPARGRAARARNRGEDAPDGLPGALEAAGGDDQPAGRRGRRRAERRGPAADEAAEEAPREPAGGADMAEPAADDPAMPE
jgi:outer membrane protein assembly factor BamB